MKRSSMHVLMCAFLLLFASAAWGGDAIPKAAWKRPLGLPLSNPGVTRVAGDIDDGYWQGVPVGGFGAGTFSRSYRGDFARWHIKAGVHKYESVYANQFAMFQQSDGDAHGTARVLMNDHPAGKELSTWQWDYPVGAGDYYALYPKAWFDYRWKSSLPMLSWSSLRRSFLITTVNPVIPLLFTAGTPITLQIRPCPFPSFCRGRICRVGSGRSRGTSTVRQIKATITTTRVKPSATRSGRNVHVPDRDLGLGNDAAASKVEHLYLLISRVLSSL